MSARPAGLLSKDVANSESSQIQVLGGEKHHEYLKRQTHQA